MLCEIKRVCYGKFDTPIKDREYRLVYGNSPVGTIDDWKEFVMDRPDFDGLRITELDGSVKEIEVHNPIMED